MSNTGRFFYFNSNVSYAYCRYACYIRYISYTYTYVYYFRYISETMSYMITHTVVYNHWCWVYIAYVAKCDILRQKK